MLFYRRTGSPKLLGYFTWFLLVFIALKLIVEKIKRIILTLLFLFFFV